MKPFPYILHATPESSVKKIQQEGFLYRNGYPTLTGSLSFVLTHATVQGYKEKPETIDETRKILVMKQPKDKIIAPGFKWAIRIDEERKEVHGNPFIWASGNGQSAIYDTPEIVRQAGSYANTDVSRKTLNDFRKKNKLDQTRKLNREIEAILVPSQELVSIGKEIKHSIRNLNTLDLPAYQQKISKAVTDNQENWIREGISLDEIVKEILETTIYQEVENFVRSLFLIHKECQWYKVYKFEDQVSVLGRNKWLIGTDVIDEVVVYIKKIQEKANAKGFNLTGEYSTQELNGYLKEHINKILQGGNI